LVEERSFAAPARSRHRVGPIVAGHRRPERFPKMSSIAAVMGSGKSDEAFDLLFDLFIDGLAAQASNGSSHDPTGQAARASCSS
jgi:hypothetical protein